MPVRSQVISYPAVRGHGLFFAENVEEVQPAHTCSLILLYTLPSIINNFFSTNNNKAAESAEQHQAARTCSLILLCIENYLCNGQQFKSGRLTFKIVPPKLFHYHVFKRLVYRNITIGTVPLTQE